MDQDPLGQIGKRLVKKGSLEAYKRLLWEGTYAVAVLNRSNGHRVYNFKMASINLTGKNKICDLWLKQNLGEHKEQISLNLPPHGFKLLKIGIASISDFVL